MTDQSPVGHALLFKSVSPTPKYRVTAFAHDGNYGQDTRGGDVSGDTPTELYDLQVAKQ